MVDKAEDQHPYQEEENMRKGMLLPLEVVGMEVREEMEDLMQI